MVNLAHGESTLHFPYYIIAWTRSLGLLDKI